MRLVKLLFQDMMNGALNWLLIPFAVIGTIVSAIALGTAPAEAGLGKGIVRLISCGIAAPVVYGLLPRLVGADLSVYSAFGSNFPMSQQDCGLVAEHCRRSWDSLRSMMPAVGGRIGPERLDELGSPVRPTCEHAFRTAPYYSPDLIT